MVDPVHFWGPLFFGFFLKIIFWVKTTRGSQTTRPQNENGASTVALRRREGRARQGGRGGGGRGRAGTQPGGRLGSVGVRAPSGVRIGSGRADSVRRRKVAVDPAKTRVGFARWPRGGISNGMLPLEQPVDLAPANRRLATRGVEGTPATVGARVPSARRAGDISSHDQEAGVSGVDVNAASSRVH